MAAPTETLGQDLKAWAADQLHVELPCTPETVRAAYWCRVRQDNGSPDQSAREALLILIGRNNTARPALALEAVETRLHLEVDAFANRFFALAITERKAHWERLRARGQGFVRVDTRLAALRPGLYIVLPHFDPGSHLEELVSVMCELFVLRPAARAARRQACLAQANRRGDWTAWSRAADLIRAKHASIAALEPRLIAKLADVDVLVEEKKQLKQRMRKVAKPAPVAKQKPSRWWIWIAAMSVSVFLRLILMGPSSPKPNPSFTPQQPPFNVPKNNVDEFLEKNKFQMEKDGDKWKLKVIPKNGEKPEQQPAPDPLRIDDANNGKAAPRPKGKPNSP